MGKTIEPFGSSRRLEPATNQNLQLIANYLGRKKNIRENIKDNVVCHGSLKFPPDAITMNDSSMIPVDRGHSQQNRISGLIDLRWWLKCFARKSWSVSSCLQVFSQYWSYQNLVWHLQSCFPNFGWFQIASRFELFFFLQNFHKTCPRPTLFLMLAGCSSGQPAQVRRKAQARRNLLWRGGEGCALCSMPLLCTDFFDEIGALAD